MLRIFGGTDRGRVREINQDDFRFEIINESTAYVVLCDGMGGESGGHIASSKAVEIISQALKRALNAQMPTSSIKGVLVSAVSAANAVIHDMGMADENLHGMGTTVVALIVKDEMVYIGHAGDSRAYMLCVDGSLLKLTRDHSIVQMLVDGGEITEAQARKHPKRNYITRALGAEEDIELDYSEYAFDRGRLLICSDGLYNYAPPEEHLDLINTCSSDQDAYMLIDEANKAGGADNITAVIVTK